MKRFLAVIAVLVIGIAIIIASGLTISYRQVEYVPPNETPFDNDLILRMEDDGRSATVLEDFSFLDPSGRAWVTPAGWVVDGASIPQSLWGAVGGPFSGRYRAASVIHDRYCDIKTHSWQEVHRVFYDAMIAANVDKPKATFMYLAVYRFGPRWDEVAVDTSSCGDADSCDDAMAMVAAVEYQPEFSEEALAELEAEVDEMFSTALPQSTGELDLTQLKAALDRDVHQEMLFESRAEIEAVNAAYIESETARLRSELGEDATIQVDGLEVRAIPAPETVVADPDEQVFAGGRYRRAASKS